MIARTLHIALLYALFALIATAVNLGSQWVILNAINDLGGLSMPEGGSLVCALLVGTSTGLVVKYVLDKRYIFRDLTTGPAVHARKFTLYAIMGIVTTIVFWGVEFLGDWLLPDSGGLYIGGALGLSFGYVIKYHLDKRFVFEPSLVAENVA